MELSMAPIILKRFTSAQFETDEKYGKYEHAPDKCHNYTEKYEKHFLSGRKTIIKILMKCFAALLHFELLFCKTIRKIIGHCV